MFLIKNIFLQQTSPTFFIVTMIAVLVFVIIIFVVGGSEEKKENKEKDNWIQNNSEKLKIQDDFLLRFIKPLSKLTPKCNKCGNGVYNIWDITSEKLTLRCYDCKKKYSLSLIEDSQIAINSLSEYIDLVSEAYNYSNEKLRKYLMDYLVYDFSYLRSNQPFIKAIKFETLSKELATSTKLTFKLIGYTEYLSFQENEYFEKENIELREIDELLNEFDDKSRILKAFDENPEVEKITVQIPAFIFGIQKVFTVYRNTIPEEKVNKNDYSIERKSRRISQTTKDKVWRRDEGKCVECGSNERLEFDHIIPFSKGGSNTYRNIQLLCEPCNRSKSDKIG